ncbi:hypothetical protein Tco_1355494 [Tanacetum coccineum]
MGDEHLSTFSVEEIVPFPIESEDTSGSDSENILSSCDDFSSINVPCDDFMTFFNPLFEFDVNFNSSDINHLFDKVLEDIECKDSYDSNLDESTFLVTPLSNSNKCLTLRDDIEFLLHHDPSTPMKSVASILEGFIDEPPFEENDDLFDLECKTNDWKRNFYDAPFDKAKCFDLGGDNDEISKFLCVLRKDIMIRRETNEPENESLITFSLKSDPLHHEFAGELITLPPRIVREHEEYLNLMRLLCDISSSRPPENFHANQSSIIVSLPTFPIPVEDNDSLREEIDIFLIPKDLIPPGIERDLESEGDVIVHNDLLNDDLNPEYERLTFDIEPDMPVINNINELNEDEC